MKLWKIYRTNDIDGIPLRVPYLYAYTEDKEILELFKSQRRSSMFLIKEDKVTKEEYSFYNARHPGYRLCPIYLKHYIGHYCSVITVVGTVVEEYKVVTNGDDLLTRILAAKTDTRLMGTTPRAMEMLNRLYYFDIMKFDNYLAQSPFLSGALDFVDSDYPMFRVDEFGMFLFLYGDSMNMQNVYDTKGEIRK